MVKAFMLLGLHECGIAMNIVHIAWHSQRSVQAIESAYSMVL